MFNVTFSHLLDIDHIIYHTHKTYKLFFKNNNNAISYRYSDTYIFDNVLTFSKFLS